MRTPKQSALTYLFIFTLALASTVMPATIDRMDLTTSEAAEWLADEDGRGRDPGSNGSTVVSIALPAMGVPLCPSDFSTRSHPPLHRLRAIPCSHLAGSRAPPSPV